MDCGDVNCPKHGTLATRGMVFDGVVVSDKMNKTVIVERQYFVKIKKYDRFKRARSRIPAHNPPCINAKNGDRVRIMECRKLSKTVSFVVTEKIPGKEEKEKKVKQAAPAEKKKAKSRSKTKTTTAVKKEDG
jgi:small subunit ribosomal protein S17